MRGLKDRQVTYEMPKEHTCGMCGKHMKIQAYGRHFKLVHNTSSKDYFSAHPEYYEKVIVPKNYIVIRGKVINKRVVRHAVSRYNITTYTILKRWLIANVNELIGQSVTRSFLMDSFYSQFSDKEWLEKLKRVINTDLSTNTYEYAVLRWNKEVADDKWAVKSDSMKGENNPAYQHGGRLSPHSENFFKYQDGTADYTIDDVRRKKNKTVADNPQNQHTKIEYYLAQGLSEEEAEKALSERQSTFSLEKCISKYGEEEGARIWQARQDKWQATLNSKTEEELNRIRMAKGTGRMNQLFNSDPSIKNISSVLYYIRFYSDDIEFWKIGITTLGIHKRFWVNDKMKHGLKYEIVFEDNMTFYDAYKREQEILEEHSKDRVIIDYNGFTTTEAFCCDVF